MSSTTCSVIVRHAIAAWPNNTTQLFTLFGFANLVLAGGNSGALKPELRPERRKVPEIPQLYAKPRVDASEKAESIPRGGRAVENAEICRTCGLISASLRQ